MPPKDPTLNHMHIIERLANAAGSTSRNLLLGLVNDPIIEVRMLVAKNPRAPMGVWVLLTDMHLCTLP